MHHDDPKKPNAFSEIAKEDITLSSGNRYGKDRRFHIAYSDYIDELLETYLKKLRNGKVCMGLHLARYFARHELNIQEIDKLTLYQAILRTKVPVIYGEKDVKFDVTDWNKDEHRILTLASNTTEALAFDNGSSGHECAIPYAYHKEPAPIHIINCFGPILKKGTPDYERLVVDGDIQYELYYADIRDKILPELLELNNSLTDRKKKGVVTIPGIGCGAYAGEFRGIIGIFLNQAIKDILTNYYKQLTNIIGVVFDPFDECEGETAEFGDGGNSIKYCVAPSAENHPYPLLDPKKRPQNIFETNRMVLAQLSTPEERLNFLSTLSPLFSHPLGPKATDIESITTNAGEFASAIGCEITAAHKLTSDARIIGGTDAMAVQTGVEGHYHPHTGTIESLRARYSYYKSLKNEEEDQGYGTIFLEKRDELLLVDDRTVAHKNYVRYDRTLRPPSKFSVKSSDALYLKQLYKKPLPEWKKQLDTLSRAKDENEKRKLKKGFFIEALGLNESTLATLFDPRMGYDKTQLIDSLFDLSEDNLESFLDCFTFVKNSFKQNLATHEKTIELEREFMPSLAHFGVWDGIVNKLIGSLALPNVATVTTQPLVLAAVVDKPFRADVWGDWDGNPLFSGMNLDVIAILLQYSHQALLSLNFNTTTDGLASITNGLQDSLFSYLALEKIKGNLYNAVQRFDVAKAKDAGQYTGFYHLIGNHECTIDGVLTSRVYMLAPDDAQGPTGKKKCNKLVEFIFQKNKQGSFDIIHHAEKRLETPQQFKNEISRVVTDLTNRGKTEYLRTKELSPYMRDYKVELDKNLNSTQALGKLREIKKVDDKKYRENYEKIFRDRATRMLTPLYFFDLTENADKEGLSDYKKSDAPGKDEFIKHLENLTREKIDEILRKPISMWNFLLAMESMPIARKLEKKAQEIRAMQSSTPQPLQTGRFVQADAPSQKSQKEDVPTLQSVEQYKEKMSALTLSMDVPLRSGWKNAGSLTSWLKIIGISGGMMRCVNGEMHLGVRPEDKDKFIKTWGIQFGIKSISKDDTMPMPYITLGLHQWMQLKDYYITNIQKKASPDEGLFYRNKLLNELGTTFDLLGQRKEVLETQLVGRSGIETVKKVVPPEKKHLQDFHSFSMFKKVLTNVETKIIDRASINVFKQYIRAYITLNYNILSSQQIDALTTLSKNENYFDKLIMSKKEYAGFISLIDIMFEEPKIAEVPHFDFLVSDLKAQLPQYQNHKELATRLRVFSDTTSSKITKEIKESLFKKQEQIETTTITVKQYEKDAYDYIYVNEKGEVHIYVPVVRGHMVGTDNTCKAKYEFNRFLSTIKTSIQDAIDDIGRDIKLLDKTGQSNDERKLKKQIKKENLEEWLRYFDKNPLNSHLYEKVKMRFAESNVVTVLQRPYSKDNVLNLGVASKHAPPETGYTSAFNRGDDGCAVELFAELSYIAGKKSLKQVGEKSLEQIGEESLLRKIKASVLAKYKLENKNEYIDSKDAEKVIQSLKETIISVLKSEYQYNIPPTFKMKGSVTVTHGKFLEGATMDVTFKNITSTLGLDEDDSIPIDYVFDCLLSVDQKSWEAFYSTVKNRNIFLEEDPNKFSIMAQFFVNSLVALYQEKGGEKVSLGQAIENEYRDAFINAVAKAYKECGSFIGPILNIVKRCFSKDSINAKINITEEEATQFFCDRFRIIDGSLHYDDFLLLSHKMQTDKANFVTLKSNISVSMIDLGLCPENFKTNRFTPDKIDLESSKIPGLSFTLDPDDYLRPEILDKLPAAEMAKEIASFLLLDIDENTKVWKVVSDTFMNTLIKHGHSEHIIKAISQNPYVSASQLTAISRRLGVTNVVDIDKQMFTWLYNICLMKDPDFLYTICYLNPPQQLTLILKKLECLPPHTIIQPLGPDKDGNFSVNCNIEKMRSIIEDAVESRDCIYVGQALVSSIYKNASKLMQSEESAKFGELNPKKDKQITENSKLIIALQRIFSGTNYDIKPDCPPYNTSYKENRILVKMHDKFGYAFQCFDNATLLSIKDKLREIDEIESRREFDEQETHILFPLLSTVDVQSIQAELNKDAEKSLWKKKISTLSEVRVEGNKCHMSLDRDNFALLIHQALTQISKELPFSKKFSKVKGGMYLRSLELSFIKSLYPSPIDGPEFAKRNSSKSSEELYNEFIKPLKQFQNYLESLADKEVLDRTIFIDPLSIERLLSGTEKPQDQGELIGKFAKDPDGVMLDSLIKLKLSPLEKMNIHEDIKSGKSDTNQVLCYKEYDAKHSCAIVCKNKDEYNAINHLIEQATNVGKTFVFNREDILLLLNEALTSPLTNKELLKRLQKEYQQHTFKLIDDEYFSVHLEYADFKKLALKAHWNSIAILDRAKDNFIKENLKKNLEKYKEQSKKEQYKKEDLTDFYCKKEFSKNQTVVNEIKKIDQQNFNIFKYTMQDIYQACFVRRREVLQQLQFFQVDQNGNTNAVGGDSYIKMVADEVKQSMTEEEYKAFDQLRYGGHSYTGHGHYTLLGSDPSIPLSLVKQFHPGMDDCYLPTEKNMKLHKDDGYFCMAVPQVGRGNVHYFSFYAPTKTKLEDLIDTVTTRALKLFFLFDNKMKQIFEEDPQSVKYTIEKNGKVRVAWSGNVEGRSGAAKAVFRKLDPYYFDFDNIFGLLDNVKSDNLSLIRNKYHTKITNLYQSIRDYALHVVTDDHFYGDDKPLQDFFKNVNEYVNVVEAAKEEIQEALKQQLFNFSNRDIALFLNLLPYSEKTEVSKQQLILALEKAKIEYGVIEKNKQQLTEVLKEANPEDSFIEKFTGKSDKGWTIQFDRKNFIKFLDVMHNHLKPTITNYQESMKPISANIETQKKEHVSQSYQLAAWVEDDEKNGQRWRKERYDLFIHEPMNTDKIELFNLIAQKNYKDAEKKIKQMPDLLIERDDRSEARNTPILAALALAHPNYNEAYKKNDDSDIKSILSFCKLLADHPNVDHLKEADLYLNTLLHKAIYYRHLCLKPPKRASTAQEFEEFAYYILDKVPYLDTYKNNFNGVEETCYSFDTDNSFKKGYEIYRLFRALNDNDTKTLLDLFESRFFDTTLANTKDKNDDTPLLIAIKKNNLEVVRKLLPLMETNDLFSKNKDGKSAADLVFDKDDAIKKEVIGAMERAKEKGPKKLTAPPVQLPEEVKTGEVKKEEIKKPAKGTPVPVPTKSSPPKPAYKEEIDRIVGDIRDKPEKINERSKDEKAATPLFSLMYRAVNAQDAAERAYSKEAVRLLIIAHQGEIKFSQACSSNGSTLLHYACYHPILADIALQIVDILQNHIEPGGTLRDVLNKENIYGETVLSNWSKGHERALGPFKGPPESLPVYKKIFDIMVTSNSVDPKQKEAMEKTLVTSHKTTEVKKETEAQPPPAVKEQELVKKTEQPSSVLNSPLVPLSKPVLSPVTKQVPGPVIPTGPVNVPVPSSSHTQEHTQIPTSSPPASTSSLPTEEKISSSSIKPGIEKGTSILIPGYLQDAIAYVNEKFLSKPYTGSFKDEQIYSSDGKTEITRPNHGLAHSLRKVAYIPLIIDFYKRYCAPKYVEEMANYTPEKIKILQIAALFSVVGRKDEKGFLDNMELYRSYRQESADAFEEYCKEQNLDEKEIAHYKTVVLEMGNTAWLYNEGKNPYPSPERNPCIDDHFLHIAHSMDLFRLVSSTTSLKNLYASFTKNGYCTGGYQGEYHKDLIQLLQFPATAIKSMGSRLSWCIQDDGKIVSTFTDYNPDFFAKTNTDPVVAVTTLNNLALPVFIKKETINLPVNKKDKKQTEFESYYLSTVKICLEDCEGDPKVEIVTTEDKLPYLKISAHGKRELLAFSNALKKGKEFGFDVSYVPSADYLILTITTIQTTNYDTFPIDFLRTFWKLYKEQLTALPLEEGSVEISSPSPALENDDQQTKAGSDPYQPEETTPTSLVVEKAITLSLGTGESKSPLPVEPTTKDENLGATVKSTDKGKEPETPTIIFKISTRRFQFNRASISILEEFGDAIISGSFSSLSQKQKGKFINSSYGDLSPAIYLLSFFVTKTELVQIINGHKFQDDLMREIEDKSVVKDVDPEFRKWKLKEIIRHMKYLQISLKPDNLNILMDKYFQELIYASNRDSIMDVISNMQQVYDKLPHVYAYRIKAKTNKVTFNSMGNVKLSKLEESEIEDYEGLNLIAENRDPYYQNAKTREKKINEFKKKLQKLIDHSSSFNPFLMSNDYKRVALRDLLQKIEDAITTKKSVTIDDVIEDWKKNKIIKKEILFEEFKNRLLEPGESGIKFRNFLSSKSENDSIKQFLALPVSTLKLESNKKSIEVLYKKIGFKLFTGVSNEDVIGVHRNIFFNDKRPGIQTATERAIKKLADEYGHLKLSSKKLSTSAPVNLSQQLHLKKGKN